MVSNPIVWKQNILWREIFWIMYGRILLTYKRCLRIKIIPYSAFLGYSFECSISLLEPLPTACSIVSNLYIVFYYNIHTYTIVLMTRSPSIITISISMSSVINMHYFIVCLVYHKMKEAVRLLYRPTSKRWVTAFIRVWLKSDARTNAYPLMSLGF